MKNSINRLYSVKSWQKKVDLQAKVKGYGDTFDIDLTDNNGVPDCCIGHFGYNFYIRTPKGLKGKKYKNIKSMFSAIKRVFKANGLEIESIGIKRYYRYRPILVK
jgi:hypothetical protein